MVKEGTVCENCSKVIKYIYCDETCGDFHSDTNDPDACNCKEHFNPEPEDFAPAITETISSSWKDFIPTNIEMTIKFDDPPRTAFDRDFIVIDRRGE